MNVLAVAKGIMGSLIPCFKLNQGIGLLGHGRMPFRRWPELKLRWWTQTLPQAYRIQWRIQDFPRGGANSQKCYYFSIFCRKLHENERIWTPGGGARPWRPPLDPPMGSTLECLQQNGKSAVIVWDKTAWIETWYTGIQMDPQAKKMYNESFAANCLTSLELWYKLLLKYVRELFPNLLIFVEVDIHIMDTKKKVDSERLS